MLRQLLREHAGAVRRLAWIDIHTGLGRTGRCERGFMGEYEATQAFARANVWWGRPAPVVHIGSSSSRSGRLTGLMWNVAVEECPRAEFTGLYMEFGTRPVLDVLEALRGDHWLHLHPQAPPALAQRIKQAMRGAFYVDTPAWKKGLVDEVRSAVHQALDGLQS